MTKNDFLAGLKIMYTDWQQVYDYFNANDGYRSGWWWSFDGNSVEEMYLTNKHPMGDESGDVIGIDDFNNYQQQ